MNQVRGEHRPGPAATRITMDKHLLSLGDFRIHERHELVDLIEGRRSEILHADLLVLEARVLDFERVQAVALETHDDGVAHLPQAGKVPPQERRPPEARPAAPAGPGVKTLHERTRARTPAYENSSQPGRIGPLVS